MFLNEKNNILEIILKCREKFGLHSVDFNDPGRPRTPKGIIQIFEGNNYK